MKRSIKRTIGVLVVLMAGTAVQAELKLVTDFEGMTGTPDGTACNGVLGGFIDSESEGTGNHTFGTIGGSNGVNYRGNSAGTLRAVGIGGITNPIEEGEAGIAFCRFMVRSASLTVRTHIGLIANATSNPINGTTAADPLTVPVGFRLVASGTGFDVATLDGVTVLKAGLVRAQWYNVWIVADNGADTFDLYISTAEGPAGAPTLPTPSDLVKSGIPFGVATTDPLNCFMFSSPTGTGQAEVIYIDEIWWDGDQGLSPSGKARSPSPADRGQDVPRDGVLGWTQGPSGAAHDVYFGTVFADVNTASRTDSKGVLVSQGQTATTFDPVGLLTFGQTYYWRVDEVNAIDQKIISGSVWTFTAEPYAYAIQPSIATASSIHEAGMGPEKTLDRSGLNASDQHSTTETEMWLSNVMGQTPAWIQYEFDNVYKLHEMWVWNSNQMVETAIGFGAKEVTIEVSQDGNAWTVLSGVPVFARATGLGDYEHNTTVEFGGILARYVKLTIRSNWGGLSPQCGLSEVRFFQVPTRAFEPSPVPGATNVALDATLSWRSGREAVSHRVYVGTDSNAVDGGTASMKAVTEGQVALTGFSPEYGRTYYWKVDEVNEAGSLPSWAGDVWSFSMVPYGVVDDFETYDDQCNRVYYAWKSGASNDENAACGESAYSGNGTGSVVGNNNPPYAERTAALVHSGRQSMPFWYDNTKSPFYSEASREWGTVQTWAGGGVDTLTVYYQFEGLTRDFAEVSPGVMVMNGMGTDIYGTSDEGRFVYKQLSGDGTIVARVDNLANTNAWSKAGVMIRETLDPGSSWAYILMSSTNGAHFQARLSTGVGATSDTSMTLPAGQTGLRAPGWVKLERKGNQFYGYYKSDAAGSDWVSIVWNPQTIVMPSTVYIGLAVTSHAAGVVCGTRFSGVTTTGSVTGVWQPVDLGVAQTAGGDVLEPVYVVVEDSGGKSKVVAGPDGKAGITGAWEELNIPLSGLTAGGVNVNSVRKVTIGVGDKVSPKAGGTGKLYIDDIRLTRTAP